MVNKSPTLNPAPPPRLVIDSAVIEPEIICILASNPPPPIIFSISLMLYPVPPDMSMESSVIPPADGILKLVLLKTTLETTPLPVIATNPLGANVNPYPSLSISKSSIEPLGPILVTLIIAPSPPPPVVVNKSPTVNPVDPVKLEIDSLLKPPEVIFINPPLPSPPVTSK